MAFVNAAVTATYCPKAGSAPPPKQDDRPDTRQHGWIVWLACGGWTCESSRNASTGHTRRGRAAGQRAHRISDSANIMVAMLAVAVGISSIVTVYRIGDSGAQSVWGDEIARLKKANGG